MDRVGPFYTNSNGFLTNTVFTCTFLNNLQYFNIWSVLTYTLPIEHVLPMILPINKQIVVFNGKNTVKGKLVEFNRHFLAIDNERSVRYVPMGWIHKDGVEIIKK